MLAGMTEHAISSTEARNNFTHCIAAAAWSGDRIVIHRYGVEMCGIVSQGDMIRLRELDRREAIAKQGAAPEPERGSYEWMKKLYEGGQIVPEPTTPEGQQAFEELLGEIVERYTEEIKAREGGARA